MTNPAEAGYRIELLSNFHDRSEFDCGVESLTHYLQKQANQDRKKKIAVPYVLVRGEDRRVLGYFTLSTYSVGGPDFPREISKKFPKYDAIPSILLGRLAVDLSLHGQGFGGVLLIEALSRAFHASGTVAAYAVVVDAIDDKAREFYSHYGFIQFANISNRLFLPMKTIEMLINDSGIV